MPYYYEDHLYGTIYTDDEIIDERDLYCEQCGDSDYFIGWYENDDEFKEDYYGKKD